MKCVKYFVALLGFLAIDSSAACAVSNGIPYCSGKLKYLWTVTDGRIYAAVSKGSDNSELKNNLILDSGFVGPDRFDRMYSLMLSAVHRSASIYVEYDSSNRITSVSVFNPDVLPPD